MPLKLKIYISFLFIFIFINVLAQKIELKVSFNDTILKTSKLIDYNKQLSLPQLKTELSGILFQLHQKAFLTASTDSIIVDSSYYQIYIRLGKSYKWTTLSNKNIDEEILSKIGFREKLYNNKPFNQQQLKNFFKKIIQFYENNGYPFASIKLDSIEINNNKLSAQLYVEKNRLYKVDSVLIYGDATISDRYIKNYIRIKEGDVYNEESIRKISARIKELPFVIEEKKWKVIFIEDKSKILLYLKKKKASRFDGILGLLPDEETGKLRLTGDIKLNLINSFHAGEKIEFNWRAIQENTQDLKFNLMYPFLVNTPLGIDYNFKLYKKDTTLFYNFISISPVYDENNTLTNFVGILKDITSDKQQQARITEQSKLASMGEMIANIAHQWRQPLSVISTAATGMQLQKEFGLLKDEDFNKTCTAINENVQYLSQTIDDFKNFIKNDSPKKYFNLNKIINKFLSLISGTMKNNEIDIIFNIDKTIEIDGYENELIQCLMNIFNNAKDAFNSKQKKLIFIDASMKNKKVLIRFKDNAGGIDEEIINKIFEPYFTTKHKYQGTGLGLHMTYNLIEDGMKGRIRVVNSLYEYENINYKGAEFIIILPLK